MQFELQKRQIKKKFIFFAHYCEKCKIGYKRQIVPFLGKKPLCKYCDNIIWSASLCKEYEPKK